MRHSNSHKKLGRVVKQRLALLKALSVSLIEHGKIRTTQTKAKELRPFIERFVTMAKNPTISHRRILVSRLNENVAKKLIDVTAKNFSQRNGGYTRIKLMPQRLSDGAKMAIIEFVK
jgi:large subunit ribosomal protein L17